MCGEKIEIKVVMKSDGGPVEFSHKGLKVVGHMFDLTLNKGVDYPVAFDLSLDSLLGSFMTASVKSDLNFTSNFNSIIVRGERGNCLAKAFITDTFISLFNEVTKGSVTEATPLMIGYGEGFGRPKSLFTNHYLSDLDSTKLGGFFERWGTFSPLKKEALIFFSKKIVSSYVGLQTCSNTQGEPYNIRGVLCSLESLIAPEKQLLKGYPALKLNRYPETELQKRLVFDLTLELIKENKIPRAIAGPSRQETIKFLTTELKDAAQLSDKVLDIDYHLGVSLRKDLEKNYLDKERVGLYELLRRHIIDGARLYKVFKDRGGFVPVKGSVLNMVRNSSFNHRLDRSLDVDEKLKLLTTDGEKTLTNLPKYFDLLPTTIQSHAMLTVEEVVRAGHLLGHCIGSQATSGNLLLRKGSVCASLCPSTAKVLECRDAYNNQTSESYDFRKEIEAAVNKVGVGVIREVSKGAKESVFGGGLRGAFQKLLDLPPTQLKHKVKEATHYCEFTVHLEWDEFVVSKTAKGIYKTLVSDCPGLSDKDIANLVFTGP